MSEFLNASFGIPYEDEISPVGHCIPKEVLLKSYTDMIGKTMDFLGQPAIIVSVYKKGNMIMINVKKERISH